MFTARTQLLLFNDAPAFQVKQHCNVGNSLINREAQYSPAYNPFQKTSIINEGNYLYTLAYGTDQQRKKTVLQNGFSTTETRIYSGRYEKETTLAGTKEFHYIPTPSGTVAVNIRTNGIGTTYYLLKDHLGSIMKVVTATGTTIEEHSFDAWGNHRNPADWGLSTFSSPLGINRGYTEHEMLPLFQLINMNGRMYDPLIGRFLSPDPYVPDATNAQDFNRYTYARNNPLLYVDPTGEFVWMPIIIGAAIGGIINVAVNSKNIDKPGQFLSYFGVGALAGALGAGIGAGAVGVAQGALYGLAAGATSGVISGVGNAITDGASFNEVIRRGYQGGLWGAATGAVLGGISGGFRAHKMGFENPWNVKLQDKLDYMMTQYKPDLADQVGEADTKILVGNNKNLKGTGWSNENGNMVKYELEGRTCAGGLTQPEKFAFANGPMGGRYKSDIFLSKNTIRGLWNGSLNAEGILLHEWCHARDYYSGVASYLNTNYPKEVATAMFELRAYQFTPNFPSIQIYLNNYDNYLRTIYPYIPAKGR